MASGTGSAQKKASTKATTTGRSASGLGLKQFRLKNATDEFVRSYVIKALIAHEWKTNDTAAWLGITRLGLYKLRTRLGIDQ